MIWILFALATLFFLDGRRMRARLKSLATIPARVTGAVDPVAHGTFIVAPGVTLGDTTRQATSAFARARDLDIVDIIPGDLPTLHAMNLAQLVDPSAYRCNRLLDGRTAGHAILVSADVAHRAGLGNDPTITPNSNVEFSELAARLRHYGATVELAVATSERAVPSPMSQRRAILTLLFGPATLYVILIQPVLWLLIGVGIWLTPMAGWLALVAWHLQPLLSVVGTPIRPRDIGLVVIARFPLELYLLTMTLFGRWRRPPQPDPVEERRAEYARLAARSTYWWEPRRRSCPLCEAGDLAVHLRVSDLYQHKPGSFTLERCRGCGHIFQNPQLSVEGLDYYYKDFYDGLGQDRMSAIFGLRTHSYRDRAGMVRTNTIVEPARWLDVGAGHGHFCVSAQTEFPTTRFDGLDVSASIDEAVHRGWIDAGYRGLFPEIASSMANRYDVVSMNHYLEHTIDPRTELAAARIALAPDGHLLIEVPDPEFWLGRFLGPLWLPWFQPQHLHLLSTSNLDRLLREQGFEPVEWHRGTAHQRIDFVCAVLIILDHVAPSSRLPWLPESVFGRIRRAVVWTLGVPFIVLGVLVDHALGPIIRRGPISNTYRVVARRLDGPLPHGTNTRRRL